MQIKKINIKNFKGFENKYFEFNKHFNVIIGNNGTGKTTLLNAIQVALGAYLQCLDIPANPSYRRQFKKNGERFVKWSEVLYDYVPKSEDTEIDICTNFSFNNGEVCWKRKLLKNDTTTHNKDTVGELMQIVKEMMTLRNEHQTNILLPLIANFGTDRKASEFRKIAKANTRRTRIEKGYLTSLKEDTNFNGAIEWIDDYDYNVNNKLDIEGTKDAFYNALKTALPYLKNIGFNKRYLQFEAEIAFESNNIGKCLHSNMSDGLKSMLYLVAELAYRCVILNGFKGIEAVNETEGVVLIDELDMHLHPKWQRHIINDLKLAFPKLQFIVTTHSPVIIQSLKLEELVFLEQGLELETDPFKKSIEEIIENEMGVENIGRSLAFTEMEDIASKYYDLIAKGKTSENNADTSILREKLNELEIKFSEDPAFVALLKSERAANNL
jgi:predicted ATP-binding protein involved in virulence